jgi:hypothetical protein
MTSVIRSPQRIRYDQTLPSLATTYRHKLIREGAPKTEARDIAIAIAKFELFQKAPTPEQKHLISTCSRFVCRAQLWHRDLLL